MVNHQNVLTAKVAILELLVRALLKDGFSKVEKPLESLDAYAARFRIGLEQTLGGDQNDPALLLAVENADNLFEQLRHELETMVRGRKST